MMMTWRRPDGKKKVRKVTIEQEDMIVYPSIIGQFHDDAASQCIIQDGRCKKYLLSKLSHPSSGSSTLKLSTKQEKSLAARPTLIILVLLGLTLNSISFNSVIHLCTLPRTDSGEPQIITSSRYQTFSSDTTPLIYCEYKQERAERVTLLHT